MKPATGLILTRTLQIRTLYAALMMLGIGMMLFAVAGSVSKDQAAAVGGWGVGFLLLSVLLLGIAGIAALWGQLVGVAARDVKNELAGESNKDTANTSTEASNASGDKELSDTERALIRLLRTNEIPPDVVAESIREVMDRRMGR
jgi:hypothetical protein